MGGIKRLWHSAAAFGAAHLMCTIRIQLASHCLFCSVSGLPLIPLLCCACAAPYALVVVLVYRAQSAQCVAHIVIRCGVWVAGYGSGWVG